MDENVYLDLIEKREQYIEIKHSIETRENEIYGILDDILYKSIPHPNESPLKLVNELYYLEIKLINIKADIVKIDKKLQKLTQ